MERLLKRFYEFDIFRIDLDERALLRDGCPVALTPKVFDILLTLVENRGHTVEKRQLIEKVWADAFVEEGNLNRNVSTLRKALGEDSHDPRFIKTVPKRGYRFDHDVRQVIEEDEELTVEKRTNYRLALSQTTETRRARTAPSVKYLIAGALAAILLSAAAIWNAMTPSIEGKSVATHKREAVELYQKARDLWKDRSVDGLHNATRYFEQAIALDPEFAPAHAGLADAYAFDVIFWKKAEAEANEALRLDPRLSQPHATIGFIRMYWEQRLADADPHFRQAITLDPDNATARQWYALNLTARSMGGSGFAEMKRALELDPASSAIEADMCQLLYLSRKFDQAIEHCRKALEINSRSFTARRHLYEIYTAKEMYPEALEEFFIAEELNMTTLSFPDHLDELKRAYSTGGIRAFWQKRLDLFNKGETGPAYEMGKYYARFGKIEEALTAFELSAKRRDFDFLFFAVDPANREVLTHPKAKPLAKLLAVQPE